MNFYANARRLIDAAHSGDPKCLDGRPAELRLRRQNGGVGSFVSRQALRSCFAWRRDASISSAGVFRAIRILRTEPDISRGEKASMAEQAERARELLLQAGVEPREAEDAATWVSKTGLQINPNTQLLEDAACLVFLENEIAGFAVQHADYPRDKFLRIIQKTWRKMSPAAREAALGLKLPSGISELVKEATQE